MADEPGSSLPIRRTGLKATLLLALTIALVVSFVIYVLYARGTFEATQQLILMADNSEGISVGTDLTFSGFPVGRVQRIELAETGQARIEVDVPRKDARWLRSTSVFTLERGLVGAARLRAFTGNLEDPPLPDGAVRFVLRGDTTDELPGLIANLRRVIENVEAMTAESSSINQALAAVRSLAERMSGRYGALSGLLGSDEEAKKVIAMIERSNALLASLDATVKRLDTVAQKVERTVDKADERVFGAGGLADGTAEVMAETKKAAAQLTGMLAEARASLQKADAMLADAQKIAANTREATEDLAALRAEVESSLRKVSQLIEEVSRKWPFKRDADLRLP